MTFEQVAHIALYIFTAYFAVYALITLTLTLLLRPGRAKQRRDRAIAVLVAARNEEDNILECLQSLNAQNFPTHLMTVYIGDDGSTDRTAEIVQAYIADKPHFQYVYINKTLPNLKGKQNVLAQLANLADADYLLVTDADVQQQPDWAATHLGALTERPNDVQPVGVSTGPTLVTGNSLFARLQGLDWLHGMAVIKALDGLRLPVTAVGNNMAVTREAYNAAGRYESIPFNIVEDYALFMAVLKKGYDWNYLFNPLVLNTSKPIGTIGELFRQRYRWFKGGQKGPRYAVGLFGFYGAQVAMLPWAFGLLPWQEALSLLGLKLLVDFFFYARALTILERPKLLLLFPVHAIYHFLFLLTFFVYMLKPAPVRWKGRKF